MHTPSIPRRRQAAALPALWCLLCLPWLTSGCGEAAAKPAPEPPKVTVQHPQQRTLTDYDEYNGWTDASAVVEVRARVRGHIETVHFEDGEFIQEGAPLFDLDPDPFQSDVDRAIEQVNIALAQQEAALKDEQRQRMLFEQNATTMVDMERAEAARKTWDAQVVAAQEEVKRKELDLTYSKITAPIGGKVSRALLTKGNLVNAGGSDPVLTTIVAVDPIHVYFAVDERALLKYRERNPPAAETAGQGNPLKESQVPFDFKLETDEGYPNRGLLDFADNRIDPTTGTIEVRGACENADTRYLPGSRVRVRVPVSEPYPAVLVPDSAILSDQTKKYLLYLNDENVVVRRDVRLGKLLDDGMRVILPGTNENEGVTPEDRVIVLGIQRARINYPVQPMDAEGEPIAAGGGREPVNDAG